MHWAGAPHGLPPHMNSFDRQHEFGNTVWLWLLEPACVVLAGLAIRDFRYTPGAAKT